MTLQGRRGFPRLLNQLLHPVRWQHESQLLPENSLVIAGCYVLLLRNTTNAISGDDRRISDCNAE